ncbi:hypothetical protein CyaNS01_01119 [Cyanobium sp. NS01]|nr:hypothetical protein CyaNS01_01119 [Cyanobium sp. NS01]
MGQLNVSGLRAQNQARGEPLGFIFPPELPPPPPLGSKITECGSAPFCGDDGISGTHLEMLEDKLWNQAIWLQTCPGSFHDDLIS